MKITRYNPNRAKVGESVFYIQSHGLHAGRPLKEPIPNSWEIQTDVKNAFEICFMLYNSRFLKTFLRGSVIPFLSLHEYKKIIHPLLENPIKEEQSTQKKVKRFTTHRHVFDATGAKKTILQAIKNSFSARTFTKLY